MPSSAGMLAGVYQRHRRGTGGRLDRQGLAGPVREPVVGAQSQHGDVDDPLVVADDLGVPPRRRLGRGLIGGVHHHLGDHPVGRRPVLGHLRCPAVLEEVLERRQQRRADRRVVGVRGPEPAVVAAQLLQHGPHLVEVVDVADDAPQRADQPVTLDGHAGGEQGAGLGMGEEQRGVEEQGT